MVVDNVFLTAIGARVGFAVALVIAAAFLITRTSLVVRKLASHKFSEATVLDLLEDLFKAGAWFSTILLVLGFLGFNQIAASLGTAAGFVALGVSFALKDVISDTVAGIYLVHDPDFNNGDQVEVDGVKGEVVDVGLRKSRVKLEDGNRRVINNSDVEKKWTLLS